MEKIQKGWAGLMRIDYSMISTQAFTDYVNISLDTEINRENTAVAQI